MRLFAVKAAWVAVPFAGIQIIRLLSNIALAWLLAPDLLGAMILINTLRTGIELLTDIGIGQSIVSNPKGGHPDFYNTAWTLQIIRGAFLFFIAVALAQPVAKLYGNNELLMLIYAVSPLFLISGFVAPSRFLLQRNLNVKFISLLDLALSTFAAISQIVLAYYMPNIWALIVGLYIGATVSAVASFLIMDFRSLRLRMHNTSIMPILNFGKWIFLSSMIFYFANSWDRLFLADYLAVASFGVYGIAKTYSETLAGLFGRISQLIVFPIVSASPLGPDDLRTRIARLRFFVLLSTASVVAFGVAVADEFIAFVYDFRYREAGIILTILLISTWFSILFTIGDAILLGSRKPAGTAFANGGKLLTLAIGLPWALDNYSLAGALIVFGLSDFIRYATIIYWSWRLRISFIVQDFMLSIIFIALVVSFRELLCLFQITGSLSSWLSEYKHLM